MVKGGLPGGKSASNRKESISGMSHSLGQKEVKVGGKEAGSQFSLVS